MVGFVPDSEGSVEMKGLCLVIACGALLQAVVCQAATWTDVSGQWTRAADGARLDQAADAWALSVREDLKGDLTIEGDFVWPPTGKDARIGFVFSYKDKDNYALCAITKEQYKAWNADHEVDLYTVGIYQAAGGKEELTNVAPWMHPKEGKHHLKLIVSKPQVLAILDGKETLQGGILPQLLGGCAGLAARYTSAEFSNIKISQTPPAFKLYGIDKVHRDPNGRTLPRWPYREMIHRPMEYVFWGAEHSTANFITDEDGKTWPPYVYAVTINLTGTIGTPNMYVPQEFSFFNNGLLDYYMYSGDKRALDRAEELARWLLAPAHRIPAEWKAGKMSVTKTIAGKVVGDVEGKAIFFWPYGKVGEVKDDELGKDLISLEEQGAGAYTVLRIYHITGKKDYLDYCKDIADGLLRLQLPEGNWHYRVSPRDGKPNDDFTANVVDNVVFLEDMGATTGNKAYTRAAEKAARWLLDVPCKNNRWLGIFGDVPSNTHIEWATIWTGRETENYSGFVAMNAARYLMSKSDKHPEYVKIARGLRTWIYDRFLGRDSNQELGIAEQTVCFHVMPYHGFHQSMVEADLYEATGDADYKKMGIHFLNAGMYQTEVNGLILLMGGGLMQSKADTWWCNIFWAPTAYVYAMGTWPELAPKGENHLVRTTAPITSISYKPEGIFYGTVRESSDRLIVKSQPKSIRCAGKALPMVTKLGKQQGWSYSAKTHLLRINHAGGKVDVAL